MASPEWVRAELSEAMSGADGNLAAADRLCLACTRLLDVDGAAISYLHQGATQGTFGSSGTLSRRLDELQFTFGEGPCLDAVRVGRPVLAADLADPTETRWPAFSGAVLDSGVRAVFALPFVIASLRVGALDLFRVEPLGLSGDALAAGMLAAELAAVPLLNLMTQNASDARADGADGWAQLASLQRIEVYQATGMIMDQLDLGPAEALVRLRAYAFAQGRTASEVAWEVVERRLVLDGDEPSGAGSDGASS